MLCRLGGDGLREKPNPEKNWFIKPITICRGETIGLTWMDDRLETLFGMR